MKLYIVRHGTAQRLDAKGDTCDAERRLTPAGRKKTVRAARGLRALGCRPNLIATSPMARAEETARILAEVLCPDAPFEICDFLAGGEFTDLAAWLSGLDLEEVMIVGHMPGIADFASQFLATGAEIRMVFKKAAVCCISFDPDSIGAGRGRLEWLLQARPLRLLAGK